MKTLVFVTFVSVHVLVMLTPLVFVHGDDASLLCKRTPYPDICTSIITTKPNQNLHDTHLTLRESALKSTLSLAEQAYRFISNINDNLHYDPTRSDLHKCIDLYAETLHHLKRCVSSSNNIADVQTGLSAAMTNTEACKNKTYMQSFPLTLSNFTKSLSNSLAINVVTVPSPIRDRRKLLLTKPRRKRAADLVVAQDGSGNYTTINEALTASEELPRRRRRFIIYVKRGVYAENVVIADSMKNYTVIGDGIDATIVTGSRNTRDGYKTFDSATFTVEGDRFIARDITFENTAGPTKQGAVALRTDSDLSIFYRCSFRGYQDTLYVHKQRQFYRDCDIYGTIDFIFGDATTILQNCNIYVRRPLDKQTPTITAQGRLDPNTNTGIVIHNSVVTAAPEFEPVEHLFKTYLGRPWQKYSRTVFMKTYLDGLIDPTGWLSWEGKPENIRTLYYAEHMNNGPGADTRERVKWPGYHVISRDEAQNFSVENFLAEDSWIQATNVPFSTDI